MPWGKEALEIGYPIPSAIFPSKTEIHASLETVLSRLYEKILDVSNRPMPSKLRRFIALRFWKSGSEWQTPVPLVPPNSRYFCPLEDVTGQTVLQADRKPHTSQPVPVLRSWTTHLTFLLGSQATTGKEINKNATTSHSTAQHHVWIYFLIKQ